MDLQQGLLCAITSEKANFTDNNCPNYNNDKTVVLNEDQEPLNHQEAMIKLSGEVIEGLKTQQKLTLGITSSIAVGIIGAVIWSAITVSTGYQIGYMAIAIGAAVGITMRYFGKGIDQIFGVSGAIIAILSCVLGNFFSIIGFVSNSQNLSYLEVLNLFDYAQLIPIMTETFSFMDVFFYGIAAVEGYKLAFRTFEEEEINSLQQ